MRQYPPDLEASLTRWEAVKDFAIRLNRLSAERRACRSERVALEALWVIHFDVTSLHLAIKDVVLAGWAFAAPILLRSMHDGLSASIAITNSRRPDFMAFKYFHARHKETLLQSGSAPEELQEEARAGIAAHKRVMTSEDNVAADEWLADQTRKNYWFQDEFQSPFRILNDYTPEISDSYRRLSSSAHFGFAGVRLFRDNPTDITIGPRLRDFRSMGIALTITSRVLVETTRVRAAFEQIDLTAEERTLAERWGA